MPSLPFRPSALRRRGLLATVLTVSTALLPVVAFAQKTANKITVAIAAAPAAKNSGNSGVVLPRFPALSPDGSRLVFSYQGDLWASPVGGGEPARRLTSHPAYDGGAVWSPDGSRIAFNSQRYGRSEVFAMPAGGGEPRRLTNFSGGNSLQGWSADGSRVLMASTRELQRRGPAYYTVGTGSAPGRPKPLLALSGMLTGELSPDGQKLVFARGSGDWQRRGYHGAANADIWVYTLATRAFQRVTAFDGEDVWPHWLPDSETVVYVSERDGTYNLYRQKIDGKAATQITHYVGDGPRLPSVARDGSRVAFEVGDHLATVALNAADAKPANVPLAVSADDKINPTETQTLTDGASDIAVASDGDQIAFVARGDVFAIDRDGGRAMRLTDTPQREEDCAWSPDGRTLIYVSHQDGEPDLYAVGSSDAGEDKLSRSLKHATRRLTHSPARKSGPRFSPDGLHMAYVRDEKNLVIVPTASVAAPKSTTSAAPTAAPPSPSEVVLPTGTVSVGSFVWSPDSRWIAFTGDDEEFNSEIYIVPTDNSKPPVNISRHPQNDVSPSWSPDGTKIFWSSERLDRQFDLYFTYLAKEDDERTDEEWARLREKKYGTSRAGSSGADAPAAGAGGAAPAATPGTTPRRRRPGTSADDPLTDGEAQPIPEPPATQPGTPVAAPPATVPATATPTPGAAPPEERPAGSAAAAGRRATPAPPTVVIDFDRIDERARRLTTLFGDENRPTTATGPDGHVLIAFGSSATGTPELSLIDFVDGGPSTPTPRRLAAGSAGDMQWAKDGRTLYYRSGVGGAIASVGPSGTDGRTIPFRARYTYSRRDLQLATYDEAWKTLDDEYYDPHFHGADWRAVWTKYRPWAAAASDPADMYDVIRLMMGHLNSSHIGVTGAISDYETTSIPTGALGVVWDETYAGPGLKIARVIRDSPADHAASRLRVGEIVTAINGQTIDKDTNPDELLADAVGERTPVQVTGLPSAGVASREVIVVPTTYAALRALLYDEWVEQNKERTHKLSGGRLAYLHIQAMDKGSQDKFEQGLYAEAHGRNGLLIDVRDNGGGSTADYLLTILTIPRHAFTIPRDGAPGYPQDRLPLYPWQKPSALLINQNSYSNAEIFAHAFATIDRGPIIGVPTFGAVISTGARTLLDGSSIRTPGRGWYNVKTGVNEEHTAARPGLAVEISPEDEIAGRDPQLEAAVKELLKTAGAPPKMPEPQPAK